MFAVQTEVCGLLVGERSEYLIVNLLKEYIQHGEHLDLLINQLLEFSYHPL